MQQSSKTPDATLITQAVAQATEAAPHAGPTTQVISLLEDLLAALPKGGDEVGVCVNMIKLDLHFISADE